MKTYLGVILWIDLKNNRKPLETYWATSTYNSIQHLIINSINKNKWEQINQYFQLPGSSEISI